MSKSGRAGASTFEILRKHELFSGTSDDQLRRLADLCRIEACAPDERIFSTGDPSRAFYVVLQGTVTVFTQSASAIDVASTLTVGHLFGEMGVMDGEPRTACAKADCETILLVFPASSLDQLMSAAPALAIQIMEQLTARYEADLPDQPPPPATCSFCGRGETEVLRIIRGAEARICDECVATFRDRIKHEPYIN